MTNTDLDGSSMVINEDNFVRIIKRYEVYSKTMEDLIQLVSAVEDNEFTEEDLMFTIKEILQDYIADLDDIEDYEMEGEDDA